MVFALFCLFCCGLLYYYDYKQILLLIVGITIGLELLLYTTNEGHPVTVCAAVRGGKIARTVHFTMQALGGNASCKLKYTKIIIHTYTQRSYIYKNDNNNYT